MLKNILHKKFFAGLFLEILFTLILILLLVHVREKSLDYVYDVQSLSEQINSLEENLVTQNLTAYDKQELEVTIDNIDSLLNKGIILIKFILPISLILLSLIFYFLIWKLISNVRLIRFIYSSILPIILFLVFIYFVLNYIAYRFYFIDKSPLFLVVITFLFLVVIYYFSYFLLSNDKSFMKNLNLFRNNLSKIVLPLFINLIINGIYFVLLFWLFFLTYAGAPIILPSVLIIITLFLINFQRIYLVNKISKVN